MTHASATPRRTPRETVEVRGVGLFTGKPSGLRIGPAEPGEGVTIRRADQPRKAAFPAHVERLSDKVPHPAFTRLPPRCTALAAHEGPAVFTVEHVLAALAGLGITDARLEIEGPEVPIGDGSALPFVTPLLEAGIRELDDHAHALVLRERVEITGPDGSRVLAEPAPAPSYTYRLDYGPNAQIPAASASWDGDPDAFVREIAPARTFALRQEAEAMAAMGLFDQLSPRDMLVIGEDGPIENAYRFPDEPARHKLLDLIGDLALVGSPLVARVVAERAGHALNHAAARAILDASR